MPRLNNLSFYLTDYSIDSDIGNQGVKIAGQDRNVVINLGKDVASLSVTAICETKSDFKNLKREFNKGELSVIELNEDLKYYAYPDAISLRGSANRPLLGEYTDWRQAEMSFLLPDSIVYGDKNCTSFNISTDSPIDGNLKNISIDGSEETPLSISLETYNITGSGYKSGITSEGWRKFGTPDCLFLPSWNNFKISYLVNNAGTMYSEITEYGIWWNLVETWVYATEFAQSLPPPNFPSNQSWEWTEISPSFDHYNSTSKTDISSYGLNSYMKQRWNDSAPDGTLNDAFAQCEAWWNLYFKSDIQCQNPGYYNFRADGFAIGPKQSLKGDLYIYDYSVDDWKSLNLGSRSGNIQVSDLHISVSNQNLSNGYLTFLYHIGTFDCYKENDSTNIPPCPCGNFSSATMSFIDLRKQRYPKLYNHYPVSDISFLNGVIANGSVNNSIADDNIIFEVWSSDQDQHLSNLLTHKELQPSEWTTNTFIPLALDIGSYDYIALAFSSTQHQVYKDWDQTTIDLIGDAGLPQYSLEFFYEDLGNDFPVILGIYDFRRINELDDTYYNYDFGEGIPQVLFKRTLDKFEVWNKLDPDFTFTLNGFLLGKYRAEYLKNFDYYFKDNYLNDSLFLASDKATSNGWLSIASSGYVYYYFNFGISLIDSPYIFMKYKSQPSSMKLIDDKGNEHSMDIPSDNISRRIYSTEYSLVPRDHAILKIEGPANISELSVSAKGSGYLFVTPYLQPNTNNDIEYEIEGIHDNINGTLCWREAT